MKNAIKFATLSLMLVTVLPLVGSAAGSKPKPVLCPVCHMPLSNNRTKANPVAMRLKKGGKIFYCCSQCHMPPRMLVKRKMKPMATPMVKEK